MRFSLMRILFILIILGKSSMVFTQHALESNYIIKTDIFSPLLGHVPSSGEYKLIFEQTSNPLVQFNPLKGFRRIKVPTYSYNIGISYFTNSILNDSEWDNFGVNPSKYNDEFLKLRGFRLQAGYRFYFNLFPFAKKSFYLSPTISYALAKVYRTDIRHSLNTSMINLNAQLGYQYVFGERFVIDLFVGIGYKSNKQTIIYPDIPNIKTDPYIQNQYLPDGVLRPTFKDCSSIVRRFPDDKIFWETLLCHTRVYGGINFGYIFIRDK